jgi:hypothetical protein
MEDRLMQIQGPYEQRLQALEQRLVYASARLDYLSAEMESLIDNHSAVLQAGATLLADPPAALPVVATRESPVDGAGPRGFQPATAPAETEPAAPARAADTDVPATPAAVTPPDGGLAPAASWGSAPDMPDDGAARAGMTEVPDAGEVIAPTPETVIAQAETPQTPAGPLESVRENLRTLPPDQTGAGGWVINIASYASESIAARKLAEFRKKGISAEQAVATVNGKTIYRVRVAGFDTRNSAKSRAETIRQQLGLKETWITRR